MQPIAYTTDKISWSFILSALRSMQADEARKPSVEFNSEAPSCIVLSCIAIEAFVNEISSLTNAFLHKHNHGQKSQYSGCVIDKEKPPRRVLDEVTNVRNDNTGSFYDRYKRLLKILDIEYPDCLHDLSSLNKLRNALVHFRECDIPIVQDDNGVIQEGQELPSELNELKERDYHGKRLFETPNGSSWTLRLSTDSMVAWNIEICLTAIEHVLNELPAGRYRDFIWKAYASREAGFDNVFAKGKHDLTVWWKRL